MGGARGCHRRGEEVAARCWRGRAWGSVRTNGLKETERERDRLEFARGGRAKGKWCEGRAQLGTSKGGGGRAYQEPCGGSPARLRHREGPVPERRRSFSGGSLCSTHARATSPESSNHHWLLSSSTHARLYRARTTAPSGQAPSGCCCLRTSRQSHSSRALCGVAWRPRVPLEGTPSGPASLEQIPPARDSAPRGAPARPLRCHSRVRALSSVADGGLANHRGRPTASASARGTKRLNATCVPASLPPFASVSSSRCAALWPLASRSLERAASVVLRAPID